MPFGLLDDGLLIPQHGVILDRRPHRGHIIVVFIVGVTRFAGGVNRQRIAQVAHVHDHAHGWQIGHCVILADIGPGRGVDNTASAAGREGTAVEQRVDQADPGLSQRLVLECGRVHLTPTPLRHIASVFSG